MKVLIYRNAIYGVSRLQITLDWRLILACRSETQNIESPYLNSVFYPLKILPGKFINDPCLGNFPMCDDYGQRDCF